MATLATLRQKVDDFIGSVAPRITNLQENYLANRGQYWQGLLTHSTMPAYTTSADGDSVADRLSDHPTDQLSRWVDILPDWLTTSLPCALQVSVYDGPLGKGWTATLFASLNGTTYRRIVNVGPETWRAAGWAQVVEARE